MKIPKDLQSRYDNINRLTDAFCKAYLNEEFADLCRKMTTKLSCSRPSPLERGDTKEWAGAILYTIGRINLLFDKTEEPYMGARELCRLFRVSQGKASAKATEIMRMFCLTKMDLEWTLPSLIDRNPDVWMISIDGFHIDARYAPRYFQEKAYRLGLIPYIPGEQEEE